VSPAVALAEQVVWGADSVRRSEWPPTSAHEPLQQHNDLMRERRLVQDDRYGSGQLNNFMYNDNLDEEDDE
jgi:hypothetical protein